MAGSECILGKNILSNSSLLNTDVVTATPMSVSNLFKTLGGKEEGFATTFNLKSYEFSHHLDNINSPPIKVSAIHPFEEDTFLSSTFSALKPFSNQKRVGQYIKKTTNKFSINAYWLPQGGHTNIPIIPTENQPHHVFTPDFSGCLLIIDKLKNGNEFKVYHVSGEKNIKSQYTDKRNPEDIKVTEISPRDYMDSDDLMLAFIFMKYEARSNGKKWHIHIQKQEGAPIGNILGELTLNGPIYPRGRDPVIIHEV